MVPYNDLYLETYSILSIPEILVNIIYYIIVFGWCNLLGYMYVKKYVYAYVCESTVYVCSVHTVSTNYHNVEK